MALAAGAGADHDVLANGAEEVVIDRGQEVARLHCCLDSAMKFWSRWKLGRCEAGRLWMWASSPA
eukprot:2264154-Rhodomonas_salina.1